LTAPEKELDELLRLTADHVDLAHCQEVDDRCRRAVACEPVDRPPLVVQAPFRGALNLPPPWDAFRHYPYRRTFDDPAAMLQDHLLDNVVPGLLLRDDNPLAIRNNHGTIQIASLLGGQWTLRDDSYPWGERFETTGPIEKILAEGIDLTRGVLPRSIDTLRFYRQKLDDHPPCGQAIQISLPDLQGPLDTAEQLWGSSIYYAFADSPGLLDRLLAKVVDAMLAASAEFRKWATDRLDPAANTQHGVVVPGRLLIRNDSAIMLSPDTYAERARPHDARLLKEVGTGSIHSCGRCGHLLDKFLEIPDLRGLDLGQPELNDVATVYAKCRERGVSVIRLTPRRDELIGGRAARAYPTGAVFLYRTNDINDAREVVRAYKGRAGPA